MSYENCYDINTLTQEVKMDENTIKFKLNKTWEKIQKKIETENITDKIERVECAFNLVYDDISEEYGKKYTLTNDEKKTISNMVVFYSLRIWIDNDKKSRQSIVSFAKQPYTPIPEQKTKCLKYYIADASSMSYYEDIYRDNILLRGRQAKKENLKYKSVPSKGQYTFLALNFMDMMRKGYLDIYRLLFFRKNFLKRTTSGKDDGLIEALKSYGDLIDYINKCTSSREYVIGCLQFVDFENAYRVELVAQISKCMLDKCIPINTRIICLIQTLYSRLQKGLTLFPSSLQTTFIGGYKYIEDAFNGTISDDDILKIGYMRQLIQDITCFLSSKFRFSKFGMWTEADYDRAANFLTADFCVMQEFETFNFDDLHDNDSLFANAMRQIYSDDRIIPEDIVSVARDDLPKKIRERNKNKKKKKR